jgi:hypothetical protein
MTFSIDPLLCVCVCFPPLDGQLYQGPAEDVLTNSAALLTETLSSSAGVPVRARDIGVDFGQRNYDDRVSEAPIVRQLNNTVDFYRRAAPDKSLKTTCCGPCAVCCADDAIKPLHVSPEGRQM